MPFQLRFLEIQDFKSYQGFHRMGPFTPFSAVIGPNGSGKSNFMDAISFVMGEEKSSLRVKKLSELIHGASINRPVSSNYASVSAIFHINDTEMSNCSYDDDCEKQKFTRSVDTSKYSSTRAKHEINGNEVQNKVYLSELEKHGINASAKNFLVFQGTVESIAMKTAKERTELFEEISGSIARKKDYDKWTEEVNKAENLTQITYQKKKSLGLERKEAQQEKEEAKKYKLLQSNLDERLVESQVFKLYHNDRKLNKFVDEKNEKCRAKERVKERKKETEEALKKAKTDAGNAQLEFTKAETEIREEEKEIARKKPDFLKAKEKVIYLNQRVEILRKQTKQAEKQEQLKEMDVGKLETELRSAEKEREEFVESESNDNSATLKILKIHQREYNRLREKSQPEINKWTSKLDRITREFKFEEEKLNHETRRKEEVGTKLQMKRREVEETQKRMDKLLEHIGVSENNIEELDKELKELQGDGIATKEKIRSLQDELEKTVHELADLRVDKEEQIRTQKRSEVIERLKDLYPGVYDRVSELAQPIHRRYQVAVTKILSGNMDAIVVDTEKTARDCIQYLKDQQIGKETFLPIDYIKPPLFNERLRNISNPKGVKMVFDLLEYKDKDLKKIILFCTGNCLVCETADDANKVAFEMDDGQRYTTVALDGTHYSSSGIISGGTADLAKKAKRWDEKMIDKLKDKKERLTEDLHDAMKMIRKESEIASIQSQIEGIRTRIQYSKKDKDMTDLKLDDATNKLQGLNSEMEKIERRRRMLEENILEKKSKLKEAKSDMNACEDNIFKDFCTKLRIDNIRQYEESELKEQQEIEQKKLDCENVIEKISSQLEFEQKKKDELTVAAKRYKKLLKEEETSLETARTSEASQMAAIDEYMRNTEKKKQNKVLLKAECEKMDDEVKAAQKDFDNTVRELSSLNKILTQIEGHIDENKAEKHSLLRQCKIKGIKIPLKRGSLDDIEEEENAEHDHRSGCKAEQLIKINYNGLEDGLTELTEDEDVEKVQETLDNQIRELEATIARIQAPSAKALQKLDEAKERLEETNREFESARKIAKDAKTQFERTKHERHNLFMRCFTHVQSRIDDIYKQLTRNQSAQAFLTPENPEEPYLGGIGFNCVAPGKRFQPMQNLSGGEKTIAALALLFAIHSYHPTPFFVLDEIDAALDNTNIAKVAEFIEDLTKVTSEDLNNKMNVIVISLKDEFYSHATGVIGVCPNNSKGQNMDCLVTKVMSLDLSNIPKAA